MRVGKARRARDVLAAVSLVRERSRTTRTVPPRFLLRLLGRNSFGSRGVSVLEAFRGFLPRSESVIRSERQKLLADASIRAEFNE